MSTTVEMLGGRPCTVERRGCDEAAGAPVVFVNGCAMPRQFWGPVADQLAREVLLFDRPGLGTPWPGRFPRLAEEVASLVDLVPPGATVVAHSMASFHVEGLVLQHPGLVGALVLVDPSIEWTRRAVWPGGQRWPRLVERVARTPVAGDVMGGVASLFTRAQTTSQLPDELRDLLHTEYASADALAAATAEFVGYEQQANDLLELRGRFTLQPPPTTVLTAIPRFPSESQRQFVERWQARHVLVTHSRHLVMLDAPEAVLAAIADPGRGPA